MFFCRNAAGTKVLILAGSHGDDESGFSALSYQDRRNIDEGYAFYLKACELAGVETVRKPKLKDMPYKEKDVPDIMKVERASPLPSKCMGNDEDLCNMTIQTAHIGYYYTLGHKLIQENV